MSPSRLTSISVGLPWGLGSVEVAVSDEIRQAAWDLHVEFQTRIAVQPLADEHGLVREAIHSLYGLFATSRENSARRRASAWHEQENGGRHRNALSMGVHETS